MITDRLLRLEREGERRVHEARDREIDRGGPGSGRRASEAMDAPMLQVATIRKMRQRLGDLQMEIDHQSNLLRRTTRNPNLPSDVKRHRVGEAEAKLAGLTADYKALEVEAEQRIFPATARKTSGALPATPRLKPETAPDFPLPRPKPGPTNTDATLSARPRPKPSRAPAPDYETDPERSSSGGNAQEWFPDKWAAKGWGGPRGPYGIPILNNSRGRIENILADKPSVFEIEDNSDAKGDPPIHADDNFGASVVVKHKEAIEEAAEEFGIDADLIRAIMFIENSHGWYDAFAPLVGQEPKTILPMNINPEIWGGPGFTRETANDPVQNIKAGARLIRQLWDRIENPTPRKVAALWQFIGAERTNHPDYREYVARVGRAVEEQPWRSWTPPTGFMGDPDAMP